MSEPTLEECIAWAEEEKAAAPFSHSMLGGICCHLRRIPVLEALADTTQRDLARVTADDAHNCRLLLRLRDRLALIVWAIADEGDRVYFGSTNDADDLRDIARELDDVKWDRIMRGAEKPDLYAELRKLRRDLGEAERERDELRAENVRLRMRVETFERVADKFDRMMDKAVIKTPGPYRVHLGGKTYTGPLVEYHGEVMSRLRGILRAALTPTPGGDDDQE